MPWNISARTARRAWLRAAQSQFRLIRKLALATVTGNPAALHDLRVAIRRLRVLLRAMEKPLAHTTALTLSRRWQHLTCNLSPLRDADVWRVLLRTLPHATPVFQRRVLSCLEQERGGLAALLTEGAWSHLQRDTGAFLKTEAPAALTLATQPDRALRKAWKQATTRAATLAQSRQLTQPDKAHTTRIACRRVRYLAEFFAIAAGRSPARRAWLKIAKHYQAAQNALGQTHDADVFLEFLADQHLRPPAQFRAELLERRTQGITRFRQAWQQRNA